MNRFYIKIGTTTTLQRPRDVHAALLPAVMFNHLAGTLFSHSSQDTPDKRNSTNQRRGGSGTAPCPALVIPAPMRWRADSSATYLGRGLSRMVKSHITGWAKVRFGGGGGRRRRGLWMAFKRLGGLPPHQAKSRRAVVNSASVLWTDASMWQAKDGTFAG